MRTPVLMCLLILLLVGCAAEANTPPSPISAFANACKTFSSGARFAISAHNKNRTAHTSLSDWVLRINAQGKATVDGDTSRFSWNPNQPVMHDDWATTPQDWTRIGGAALSGRLTDLWMSCRSGFTDWTWGTPVQEDSTYRVTATMPYAWAAGFHVEFALKGTSAGDLTSVAVYAPGVPTTTNLRASHFLYVSIAEFNVQLAPNALNPDLPYGAKSPVPWTWLCNPHADISCLQRTGWAPAGTKGPLFD